MIKYNIPHQIQIVARVNVLYNIHESNQDKLHDLPHMEILIQCLYKEEYNSINKLYNLFVAYHHMPNT